MGSGKEFALQSTQPAAEDIVLGISFSTESLFQLPLPMSLPKEMEIFPISPEMIEPRGDTADSQIPLFDFPDRPLDPEELEARIQSYSADNLKFR